MNSVLNTLSEYTYFYISKNITLYTFSLLFRIIESLNKKKSNKKRKYLLKKMNSLENGEVSVVPLLNFEGGPGVPFLNIRGVPDFKL